MREQLKASGIGGARQSTRNDREHVREAAFTAVLAIGVLRTVYKSRKIVQKLSEHS